jgi:hypothetical protein
MKPMDDSSRNRTTEELIRELGRHIDHSFSFPPWYRSSWFEGLLALLGVSLICVLFEWFLGVSYDTLRILSIVLGLTVAVLGVNLNESRKEIRDLQARLKGRDLAASQGDQEGMTEECVWSKGIRLGTIAICLRCRRSISLDADHEAESGHAAIIEHHGIYYFQRDGRWNKYESDGRATLMVLTIAGSLAFGIWLFPHWQVRAHYRDQGHFVVLKESQDHPWPVGATGYGFLFAPPDLNPDLQLLTRQDEKGDWWGFDVVVDWQRQFYEWGTLVFVTGVALWRLTLAGDRRLRLRLRVSE